MATGSTISICNRALLASGSRSQISTLNEQSVAADTLNTLFIPTYEALARAAWWNCFRGQTTLGLLKAAQGTPENPQGTSLPLPPSPWLYEYAQPVNALHNRYIVPSLPSSGGSALTTYNNSASTWILTEATQIKFATAYDTDSTGNPLNVILTNQTQAQLVYTVNQPNPALWDSQFQAAYVAALASYLSTPLTLSSSLMQGNKTAAERMIMEARAADANEGSNTQDRVPDWMQARRGARSAAYYGGNNWQSAGYVNMAWPG